MEWWFEGCIKRTVKILTDKFNGVVEAILKWSLDFSEWIGRRKDIQNNHSNFNDKSNGKSDKWNGGSRGVLKEPLKF